MSGRGAVSCYDKAVELLARRPHFRRELERKLASRRYAAEEIAAVLDRLAAQGYLNDEQVAVDWLAARARRGAEGKRRLAAELARHGAAGEAVRSALATLPEDDGEGARAAAEAWRRRGGKDAQGLARHLERKGFSRRAIVAVLREHGSEAAGELAEAWDAGAVEEG